ncbi:type II toxin-antitoxin system CcdA family antitoxin [Pseudomonas sp. NY15436]|uniref:type II toxin-antitoxin system CcdA family antitoxin n=1 Tax=Pseudomonas sp. NY15436 TaxID=3400359 RepID=UPI003A84BB7B
MQLAHEQKEAKAVGALHWLPIMVCINYWFERLRENATSSAYDPHAPKRTANLRVNGDLLNKAKGLDVNVSGTLEQALKEKQREQWLEENVQAINSYNEYVETHGVFSDDLRSF